MVLFPFGGRDSHVADGIAVGRDAGLGQQDSLSLSLPDELGFHFVPLRVIYFVAVMLVRCRQGDVDFRQVVRVEGVGVVEHHRRALGPGVQHLRHAADAMSQD